MAALVFRLEYLGSSGIGVLFWRPNAVLRVQGLRFRIGDF